MSVRVKCPTCRLEHDYDTQSPFRPFCSERCRLIDLGAWSQERFRIADAEAPADEALMESLKDEFAQ